MSTQIMALCWPLQMPPTAKAVLISLADNANDSGYCWPSIETICERTCFSRRAVIDAIHWLEAEKYVTADRSNGRKTAYWVTPNQCSRRTCAADAPVQQTHKTGAAPALDRCSSRTLTVINRQEPSERKDARARAVPRPEGVTELVWSDFLAIRRAKKSPITATALAGIEREAAKAGVTLAAALATCCERGWQSFKAEWLAQPARASPSRRSSAVESGLALAGYTRKQPETIDVLATESAAPRLG